MNHFDVVIVGAGVSGIGAAWHLRERNPNKTYTILENRDAIGGTWDLFRYPGIRSDSDMHTFGYRFKPWLDAKAIADGPSIRQYVNETADESDIRQHIRFKQKVTSASWSTADAQWTVTTTQADTSEAMQYTCNFLFMCGGYYNYNEGYTPEFEGIDEFQGTIVHPQQWPEDLDYSGKRVIVIGSGATAMTLVPSMANDCAHITMAQRSPTYVASRPAEDAIANTLRKWLPAKWAYGLTRFKNVQMQRWIYQQSRVNPGKMKARLIAMAKQALGPDYDVEKHFTPSYNPWDQRLCLVPNNDLFKAINAGRAEVVTDQIETFTETGLRLKSGQELTADIIVTATGLNLVVLNGVQLAIDGKAVNPADTVSYKGMMLSGVPNLVQTFGYINASWTLRADLTSEYVCRLLSHMDDLGVRQCTPQLTEDDAGMQMRPWIDDFSAGYMQRTMHLMPKQGDRDPWRNTQDYAADKKLIRRGPIDDGRLVFTNPPASASTSTGAQESVVEEADAAA